MDEMLQRLNRIYPNSGYVKIPKYEPTQWEGREYDSHFDIKAPVTKNWTRTPMSYNEACKAVDEGFRIGWVIPKGLVVVDIDNCDDPQSLQCIENILKLFEVKYSYNYTFHGAHLLFTDKTQSLKSEIKTKCGLNIVVDTRANGTGYIVLPCNDPHRSWGNWNDYNEEIPYFLKPVLKDNTSSFIGMRNGDGRNSLLFEWFCKLRRTHKLSVEEIEKTIRIINERLFAEPMSNKELFSTILRKSNQSEDKVQNEDKVKDRNAFEQMACELMTKFDIISYYSNFYKFNGIYYEPINDIQVHQMIHTEISPNISTAGRKEIIEFLKIKTQINDKDFDKEWHKIAVANGILNLVTGQLEEPNKTEYNTIAIPWKYNPDPQYSPRIDQFIKELCAGDPIKMKFVYQIAGYCLLKKNIFEKFFLFRGEGGTGKSTYTNLIHKLVGGDTNTAHVSLSEFDQDYYLATLLSKLVNIDDDAVDNKVLRNTGRFKSIVSGNIIAVRQIYREVISFEPFATCIFNCNKLPMIMDRTSGLYRRMILVELNNKVQCPDPLFMQKITDQDMEYFLFKAVEGIQQTLEEGHFIISTSEQELLKIFKRRQNPLLEWLYDGQLTMKDIHNVKPIVLYHIFTEWCDNNGYSKAMNMFSFKDEMCALFDVEITFDESDDGKYTQVFFKRGTIDPDFKPY